MAKRMLYVWSARILMCLAAAITAALTQFIVGYVLVQGVPNLSWEFISTKPSYLTESIGILPDILNTLYIVLATLVIVIPLGVGAAVYLTEYATNQKVVGIIEYAAEALSGIPSIIYGLVLRMMVGKFIIAKVREPASKQVPKLLENISIPTRP